MKPNKFFRNYVTMALCGVAVTALAVAAISKDEVNKKVAELTAPYNNNTSRMKFEFTDLEVNADRALKAGLNIDMWQLGSNNELRFVIDNLKYQYDEKSPKVTFNGKMDLDLVKAFGQKEVNKMAEQLGKLPAEFAKEMTQEYGTAAHIDAAVDELSKDEQGDVTKVKTHLNVNVNFEQLPTTVPVSSVVIQSAQIEIAATRTSIGVQVSVVMNPQYSSFQRNQDGLKEDIEKLLNNDPQVYQTIKSNIEWLYKTGKGLVESKPDSGDER